MEAEKESKTGEPLSLSQILLSTNNPFASSTKKDKSSPEQSKKGPLVPTSKFEFVQIHGDNPEKNRRPKKTRKIADVGSSKSKVLSSEQESSLAMEKAKKLKSTLSRQYPSFIKEMTPSDVTHHFFMRFPRGFSKSHLPTDEETIIVLEDEKGKQHKTKYLPHWASLSAGWRRFTIEKNLRENDVLVFHLVQPCKFKVYILRTDDFDPVDKDLSIQKPIQINLKKKRASVKPKDRPMVVETKIFQKDSEANNSTTDNHDSPTIANVMFSKSISSFRKFKIIVENKTIDSEIPKQIRTSYFDMCRTRKTSLHRHLIKGINRKLAASIISETINIADAIKNSEISTPREKLSYWNTALQSFEFLGMDVGFIMVRLNHLLGIARDCSKAITDLNKNKKIEDVSEVERIKAEIREYENKIEELRSLKKEVEMRESEAMNEIIEKFKVMYEEEAKGPW